MNVSQRPGEHSDALLAAALDYAARGWHVLPLDGKGPRTSHALLDATTDADTIRSWWARWPHANVGIACAASNLLAIDVDPRNGGDETLAALIARHGHPPATVEAATGGGGKHLVYALAPDHKVPGKLGQGVDLKHDGYVVAPPSTHPDTGNAYEWVRGAAPDDLEPVEAPLDWIEASVAEGRRGKHVQKASDEWTVPEGERHDAFVSIAGLLRHNLALTSDEIDEMMHAVSWRFGDALDRDEHIRKIARSMESYLPGEVPWKVRFPNAKRATSGDGARVVSRAFSSIDRKKIRWLWEGRIARGEVTILGGDPGLGKSQLTCLLSAMTTDEGGRVLMASAEDSPEYTIRPRLEVTVPRADLDRIHYVTLDTGDGLEGAIRLPDDVGSLREHVRDLGGVDLVIVDPLMAHLPNAVDAYRDQHVRQAIAPLKQLAEDYEAAVLVVMHLKKPNGGDTALNRLGGSIGFGAAARSVLMLARDPEDELGDYGPARVLMNVKNNLAREARTLRCEIEEATVPPVSGQLSLTTTSRIVIGEECDVSVDDALGGSDAEPSAPKRNVAAEFVVESLAEGPVWSKTWEEDAVQDGIAAMTLRRAAKELGVKKRQMPGGGWMTFPPDWSDDQVDEHQAPDRVPDHLPDAPLATGGSPVLGAPDAGAGDRADATDHQTKMTAADDSSGKDRPQAVGGPSGSENAEAAR